MSHKMLRPFIVKVSVLGYFPLYIQYYGIPYVYIPILVADWVYYDDILCYIQ